MSEWKSHFIKRSNSLGWTKKWLIFRQAMYTNFGIGNLNSIQKGKDKYNAKVIDYNADLNMVLAGIEQSKEYGHWHGD